ncbi:MAG: class I SAM-dependent methyltransferase [Candidatus Hydrogenedentota bacterium]
MNDDPVKMKNFLGKMLVELGAAAAGSLVLIGDRLGLYRTLAQEGPLTSEALASATGTSERYVREWASAQAASGYINYDTETKTFSMSPEQIAVFADPDSPYNMTGGYYSVSSLWHDEPKLTEAFKSGDGVAWAEHHPCLFCGTEKFFRPAYTKNLVDEWIPALDGVHDKLRSGAKVADVGCGHGVSTVVMAKAYPNSTFVGFDYHGPSIEAACANAAQAGAANVKFETVAAKEFPGSDYDLVCYFDCLHDMGDPVGALRHAHKALKPGGALFLVEPFAHDTLEENLNPFGRVFYSFSTMVCTPASLSQEVGLALGAQAGEKRLRAVAEEAGFSSFRRAAQTAFNLVLEAKP